MCRLCSYNSQRELVSDDFGRADLLNFFFFVVATKFIKFVVQWFADEVAYSIETAGIAAAAGVFRHPPLAWRGGGALNAPSR